MHTVLLLLHVAVAIALIGLVLVQHGKGADAGAAFGSGASSTVFGARGSGGFLSRLTGGLAASFFATSLLLAYVVIQREEPQSVVERMPVEVVPAVPASGAPADVPVSPAK